MSSPVSDGAESWIDLVFDAIVSEIQLSGYFDKVQIHEPKKKPGYGLKAAIWLQNMVPLPQASGLTVTSALCVFIVRMYSNMLAEPQDAIDPNLMRAGSNVIRRFHDNFDFGLDPLVRNVDLLGESGVALALNAGYVEMDNTHYRVMDITLPVIIQDMWTQTK